MDKKSGDFSMEDAVRFVNSPAGRQLMELLRRSEDPGLRQAMEQAARGDLEQAKRSLSSVAADQQVQQLLRKMGG